MRTKALLLAAAFAAVGVSTSVAQVYSVNAVGYVNVPLTPGFNLVSNPLDAGADGNVVSNLFKNISGTLNGFRVYVYDNTTGGYKTANWTPIPLPARYTGAGAGETIPVGQGVFVFNPDVLNSAPRTLTFVGEVKQGDLVNPLPKDQFAIRANMVPQTGSPQTFGLVGQAGDRFFKFDKSTGGYETYSYVAAPFNSWRRNNANVQLPSIEVGEAFFFYKATVDGSWNRTFNVNNPS